MESVTTPFGRRAMTLGMLASQVRSRDVAPDKTADKWKLYRALCEARLKLRLTDRALAILNALLSFYPKTELSAEHGLVVFPSNAQLSLRANGMAEQTIRRHLAVLVKAGLISRKDSANGKRYARRDEEGVVNEAFGFSLAPLLARAEEFEALAAAVVAERLQLQRAREHLTITRRDVAKLIAAALEEAAPGDWTAMRLRYQAVVAHLPRKPELDAVRRALDDMKSVEVDVLKQLELLQNARNLSGNPSQDERHIQNSKSESLSELEPLSKNERGEMPASETKAKREPEESETDRPLPRLRGVVPDQDNDRERPAKPQPAGIRQFPLGMVLSACPEILPYGPGGNVDSWRDLMTAAVVVRTMLGVSPSAYDEACAVMSRENAAAAMACILEKGGHINSAGGYLTDLTRRADRGQFSLGPMLMALMRGRAPASTGRAAAS